MLPSLPEYREIPSISPELKEVRKQLLLGLYLGGLYFEGLLGEKVTCVCQKLTIRCTIKRLITTFNAQNFTKRQSKYRGSIYHGHSIH